MSCMSHNLLYIWTYLSQNIQILHEISGILDYLRQNVMHETEITLDLYIFESEHSDIDMPIKWNFRLFETKCHA